MLVTQRGRRTLWRQLSHNVSGGLSWRPIDHQRLWTNDGARFRAAALRRGRDRIFAEKNEKRGKRTLAGKHASLDLKLRDGIDPNLRLSFVYFDSVSDLDMLSFDTVKHSRAFDGRRIRNPADKRLVRGYAAAIF
jgi:hypothetical protein